MRAPHIILALLLAASSITAVQAQYFGRNKPNYEQFDFKVYKTPHFEIYHYLNNQEKLAELAGWSEHWYGLHQRVLRDTILGLNPLIFYNDHADFQQTNTIGGSVGVGTGGVTEALKNRVIMPIAMSNQQTFHVLGHEMVHAFQYDMILKGDSTSMRDFGNIPLWMTEGLAEYLSIGSVDPHTAMWMRDAVLHDDVPTIKQLSNPKYFPYRYGQAFWAFLTGLQGDKVIAPFYVATARFGFDEACKKVLNMSSADLSKLWVDAIKLKFGPYLGDKKEDPAGKELINSKNGGEMNLSPEISPNGRYVMFMSERSLFSIDLYLADARTGEVLRKVANTLTDGHIDDYNFIESSGAWSPDSRQFAFVAVSKGQNILVIKEALSGKTLREVKIKGLPAFSNPAWSPDGKTIVVCGLLDGQVDLFSYNLKNKNLTRLTNDRYSEMHPEWTADGAQLLFATDELSWRRGSDQGRWTFNIASLDIVSGQTRHFDVFPGADNLNPVQDTAGNILFLSDRDGFRNIYKYETATGKVYQLTRLLTGVSGITQYSPAMSVDARRDRLVYSYYSKNNYMIYTARPADFLNEEVDPLAVNFEAAQLPRVNKRADMVVDPQIAQGVDEAALAAESEKYLASPYKSKFKLDYVGGSTAIGIGNSPTFGTTTGAAGGVDLLFSDMVGNHQLYTSLALNGEVSDFGGIVAYFNREHRINWGGVISHIPYRFSSGYNFGGLDTVPISDDLAIQAYEYNYQIYRLFTQEIGAFAQLPFTSTLRVEAGGYYTHYSGRVDEYKDYYEAIDDDGNPDTWPLIGNLIAQDREKVGKLPRYDTWRLEAALVGDNSVFGLTAPLAGHRFRVGVNQYFGEFHYAEALADFRFYKFLKPMGFAFRAMHYGRYGRDHMSGYDMYVGSPWFMHGLNTGGISQTLFENGIQIDQLLGSKVMVSNFEVRLPFTGPKRLALIPSKVLFTDLNLFVDGGMSWYLPSQFSENTYKKDAFGNIILDENGDPLIEYYKVRPIFTAGMSLRFNLFGAMVLEPYYAFPLVKNTRGVFGLNIIPGW
jgi:Tol biopolymer transport system component